MKPKYKIEYGPFAAAYIRHSVVVHQHNFHNTNVVLFTTLPELSEDYTPVAMFKVKRKEQLNLQS